MLALLLSLAFGGAIVAMALLGMGKKRPALIVFGLSTLVIFYAFFFVE